MKYEIEVKFLDIDIDTIRNNLEKAGATLVQPMRLMRRALIEEPEHKAQNAFLRIRDEGNKVTLAYKRRDEKHPTKIDSVKEIEVTVDDFDKTIELFQEAGWRYTTFQETKRETWQLGNAEVVIDQWPWLPISIEIEAASESMVRETAEQLGLSWNDAFYGHIDDVYALHYTFKKGVRGIIDVADARLSDPLPEQFKG